MRVCKGRQRPLDILGGQQLRDVLIAVAVPGFDLKQDDALRRSAGHIAQLPQQVVIAIDHASPAPQLDALPARIIQRRAGFRLDCRA